jgi:hypothetical protein
MKFRRYSILAVLLLPLAAPARAGDSAVATCGPNDGYVTLYYSLDNYEMAARLQCGDPLKLLDDQKSYAAQHTPYLHVETTEGAQGYVARTAITIVHNTSLATRPAGMKPSMPEASTQPPAQVSAPLATPPSEVRVLDGTELEVKLSADLSSDHTSEGAIVNLEVVQPLVIDGVIVFERGAAAHAQITQVKKAARWGHDGEISWTMQDVATVDGTRIPARFISEFKNASGSGPATGIVAATGNSMLVEQSSFSLHKGDAAFIPAGQIFKIFLHGDAIVHLSPLASAHP